MARKKGVSKSKSSVRKTTCDNTNAVEEDNKLKDDPGGGPQAMDEIKYLSNIKSQAVNQSEISQQNQIHDHHHRHNNSNNLTNHFSDHKYLHKKFKRIASATVVDNINTPVIDSLPINSNEFMTTNSQPQHANPEIVDKPTDKLQLSDSLEDRIHRNLKEDKIDEQVAKLKSLPSHQNMKQQHNQEKSSLTLSTTTIPNGLSSSDTYDSLSVNLANNMSEKTKPVANSSSSANVTQLDIANIYCQQRKSANIIVANYSSAKSVNKTETYLVPNEIHFQQKPQTIMKSSTQESSNSQQHNLAPNTPPTINHQPSSSTGKSSFIAYPVKSTMHHYQSIGEVVRNEMVNSIPMLRAPAQLKMQYPQSHTNDAVHTPGRYVCPYCDLNCTKPSVLQKHIRAHTNERPYPCDVCGFAFKTSSNLLKHCRSRTHALRLQGGEQPSNDDLSLAGSDQDQDQELSSSASSDIISETASPIEERVSSPSSLQTEKPYKPKFHNAALYTSDEQQKQKLLQQQQQTSSVATTSGSISISHPLTTQNVEYLKERISKIISENETIMEVVEAPLKKKYRKITGISRGIVINDNSSTKLAMALMKQREELQNNSNNNVTSANAQQNNTAAVVSSSSNQNIRQTLPTLQQQAQQVLQTSQFSMNLSKILESTENQRKRRFSEGFPANQEVATHPQNPERSIIKDLLLNSRGLAISTGEGDEAVYTCPLCKITFRSADNLQYHTKCYCQGSQASLPPSTSISPVDSPSHKYFRSNSFNVNLPEKYNPNTLAKLASSTLRHPNKTPLSLAKLAQTKIKPGRPKPENIVINKDTCPAPTPLPTQSISVQCAPIAKLIDAPLPSPGPLLGKTRLVDTYNGDRMTEEAVISHFTGERDNPTPAYSTKAYSSDEKYNEKRARLESYSINSPVFLTSMEQLNSPNTRLLQMCGGDLKIVERREETLPKFGSSGGSIVSISPTSDCHTPEPFGIRSGLLSGGGAVDIDSISSKETSSFVLTPKHVPGHLTGQYFQFPPISPIITGYNPLTLPPVQATTIVHGGRIIPHIPGIPGPNSLSPRAVSPLRRIPSPTNRRIVPSPLTIPSSIAVMGNNNMSAPKFTVPTTTQIHKTLTTRSIPNIKIDDSEEKSKKLGLNGITDHVISQLSVKQDQKRPFNFSRIAENLSPRNDVKKVIHEPLDADVRYFNFDNLVPKPEVKSSHTSPLHIDVSSTPVLLSNRLEEVTISSESTKSTKFLRPTSLPLKPGTFTPKRHHGITPTANTLPLISPETPRPSKSCVQLYLNGHAYTYLGLKCSTKTFYCTVNRPQPVHFTNQHKLSIYSNWQICAESDPHPLGLTPKNAMFLYDSRQRPTKYTMAQTTQTCTTLHSQSLIVTPFDNNKSSSSTDLSGNRNVTPIKSDVPAPAPTVSGGYESNEVYTYVRGRGRGRYVCSECGIRCKKPSMLKKHIRTHSDVRPYTCQHCLFSFKTKGNLTKHMKSKAHYKKCVELGLTPLPSAVDDDGVDDDMEGASMTSGDLTSTIPGDSDTDDLSDGDDGENDSSDTSDSKLRLPEHEAAKCLLYLSQTPPGNSMTPNLIPGRPMTYPYGDQPSQVLSQSNVDHIGGRRLISFQTSPSFDYSPKHDQYYSNPKVPLVAQKFEDSNSMPIDLTKPRDTQQPSQPQIYSVQQNSGDVDGMMKGPVGFLSSLVSITDRVPTHQLVVPKVDENVYMQTYLTERALQDSKMKQSQMYRIQQGVTTPVTTTISTSTVMSTPDVEHKRISVALTSIEKPTFHNSTNVPNAVALNSGVLFIEKKSHQNSLNVISTSLPPQIKVKKITDKVVVSSQNGNYRDFDKSVVSEKLENRFERNDDNISGMDTLAEIAASSVKLDITQNRIKVVDTENANVLCGQQANSAKSVASEYLKMTSAEFMKAHQYKSDREESDESGESDDEAGSIKPVEFNSVLARKVVVGEDGFKGNASEYSVVHPRILIQEDGRSACSICSKTFPKKHQMILHMNIHYMERKFRCDSCAVSFRTQGHLQKHERSEAHKNKVLMTSTFGNVTTSNPRPFECSDCNIAFRIHGHLAKHLRSKTHVQKLECLQKLPFGTYAEIERAGISLTDIDTTDCHNSLASLKILAQRLLDKDPSKLSSWSQGDEHQVGNYGNESKESYSDDGEPICSPDDGTISDKEKSGVNISENNIVSIPLKRKSEINGTNELNESGVENHEKRLKIFSDT